MTSTASPGGLNQFPVTLAFDHRDDEVLGEGHVVVEYAMRMAIYAGLTAVFLMVIALIVKLMWSCDEEEAGAGGEAARATENSRLLSKEEAVFTSYGTSGEDLESGSSSSCEDLYDGTICVICYDDQRNCFFIPCGHCVACHACAQDFQRGKQELSNMPREY